MEQQNEIEEKERNKTTAFWEAVASTARVIIQTLPSCGSSSLVAESRTMRESLTRIVGIMENNLLLGAERMSDSLPNAESIRGAG